MDLTRPPCRSLLHREAVNDVFSHERNTPVRVSKISPIPRPSKISEGAWEIFIYYNSQRLPITVNVHLKD